MVGHFPQPSAMESRDGILRARSLSVLLQMGGERPPGVVPGKDARLAATGTPDCPEQRDLPIKKLASGGTAYRETHDYTDEVINGQAIGQPDCDRRRNISDFRSSCLVAYAAVPRIPSPLGFPAKSALTSIATCKAQVFA
jgi:hypothetical protein